MTTATKEKKPPKDRFMDQWRAAEGAPARALLEDVQRAVDASGPYVPRRPDQEACWRSMVEVVAMNLVEAVLTPPITGQLVMPIRFRRNTPKRYRNPVIGKALGGLQDRLQAAGLALMTKGRRQGKEATTARPGPAMEALVEAHGVSLQDLGWSPMRGDTIILTRQPKGNRKGKPKPWVDYLETPETETMRREMAIINTSLARADLSFIDDGLGLVSTGNRWVSRRFTVLPKQPERFDQVGRVFGGFWQTMAKERRTGLRINGEECLVLDYSSMFTRIAFAEAGVLPPPGDLYEVPGLVGLSRAHRKAAFNTFLFTRPGIRAWPKDLFDDGDLGGGGLPPFPAGWKPQRVRRAILAHHPCLTVAFNTGPVAEAPSAGYRLMFSESVILVRLLLELARLGLTALPLHDALIVPCSSAGAVRDLMVGMAMEITGHCFPVELD